MNTTLIGSAAGLAGILAGYGVRALLGRWQAASIEKQADAKLEAAEQEVKNLLREGEIQARSAVVKAREDFENSTKEHRQELQAYDERLTLREQNLERKLKVVETREEGLDALQKELKREEDELDKRRIESDRRSHELDQRRQRLAAMTQEEARRELRAKVEDQVRAETGSLLRRMQEEVREQVDKEAREIISMAVQRHAAAHASDNQTALVPLSSKDIKGRIVGRDGRNIRAIEASTGVTILVDDTPDAIVISCFDPVRREIARQTMEALISDGRIHPSRIEEEVVKARSRLDETILQAGRDAAYELNVQHADSTLLRQLGTLKFRTSYSQNVLLHSMEVARIMGLLADQLGLDVQIARRVGLFHDIGKGADQDSEGGHALIGAAMLRRARENPIVVNAVESHHGEVESTNLYGILCSAADAISSARPGARKESSELYVQRLEKLETIAKNIKGVNSSFAVQAGREVRVIVDPEEISDNEAMLMAREVCQQIVDQVNYPGQIRVVVVREKRYIEYAR